MHPEVETLGAGLSKDNSVELGGYRYPTLTVYADTSEETVYNFIKAILDLMLNKKPIFPKKPNLIKASKGINIHVYK